MVKNEYELSTTITRASTECLIIRSTTNQRLRGSVSTVVTVTSKVKGKWKFWAPVDLKPLKILKQKLDWMITLSSLQPCQFFCGNRSNWLCSPYCWNTLYLWLWVVIEIVFSPFPFSWRRLQQKRVDIFSRCIPLISGILIPMNTDNQSFF